MDTDLDTRAKKPASCQHPCSLNPSRCAPAQTGVTPTHSKLRYTALARAACVAGTVVAGAAASVAGCGAAAARNFGASVIMLMPGVVNRPDNKSLRFALLKYGLDGFCQEMLERSAPLVLGEGQPAVGRFFPERCDSRIVDDDTKTFVVQFSGFGYAYTNVTQRLGFGAAGVVEYAPDFVIDGSSMYVYFKTQRITASNFQTLMVESPAANAALLLGSGGFAEKVGRDLVSSELSRGFTVVRDADGQTDLGLGMVEKGKKPFHPYQVREGSRVVVANERVEIHGSQREFLGPLSVESDGKALYLTMALDGLPALDVLVFARDAAQPWLANYVRSAPALPPLYAPVAQEVLVAGAPWRKAIPVPKGRYYIVLDNTSTAGRVAPPGQGLDDRAALVDCAIELGDAP